MKHVTFEEYQTAKHEIIGGVEYKESSSLEGNTIRKTYATEKNGTFYEVNNAGRVEFWSDKQPDSRIYDETEKTPPVQQGEGEPETITFCEMNKRSGGCPECPNRYVCKKMTGYDKFVLDRGWEFKTDEALKAGYERLWKCKNNILLTQDEFLCEAKKHESEATKKVYAALSALVESGKLAASDIYSYARFRWCLNDENAIVAYQIERGKWQVNNCDTEITEDAAKIRVCQEFGFEASRIKIIGNPYYDATDYNFIRFDCGGWAWLMRNGSIYQVYQ